MKSCLLSERSWFKTEHAAKYVESIILGEALAKNKNTNNGNFFCFFFKFNFIFSQWRMGDVEPAQSDVCERLIAFVSRP